MKSWYFYLLDATALRRQALSPQHTADQVITHSHAELVQDGH